MTWVSPGKKRHYCKHPNRRARKAVGAESGALWRCDECGLLYIWKIGYYGWDWEQIYE